MPVIETAGTTLFILGLTQLSAGPTVAGATISGAGATISGANAFGIGLASTFIGGVLLVSLSIICQYRAYDKTLTPFDNFKKMKNDGKSDEEIIEQFRYFFDNNNEKAKEIKDEYFNGVFSEREIEDRKTKIEAYKTTHQDEKTEMKQAFQSLNDVLKIYQAKDKTLPFEESAKLLKLKDQHEKMSDQDFAKLLVLDYKIQLYHAENYATKKANISKLSPVSADDPVEETENKSFASSGSAELPEVAITTAGEDIQSDNAAGATKQEDNVGGAELPKAASGDKKEESTQGRGNQLKRFVRFLIEKKANTTADDGRGAGLAENDTEATSQPGNAASTAEGKISKPFATDLRKVIIRSQTMSRGS